MSNKPRFHKWLCPIEPKNMSGVFSMIPPEIFRTEEVKNLSPAGRAFYICLNIHKETLEQQHLLYTVLTEYNNLFGLGLSEIDIFYEAYPFRAKKDNLSHGYFVIPDKHLKQYGYSPQYASKLKKELIKKGFIRIKYGGKGKCSVWSKNVTIYQFIDKWKHLPLNHRFIVKRSPIVKKTRFWGSHNMLKSHKYVHHSKANT